LSFCCGPWFFFPSDFFPPLFPSPEGPIFSLFPPLLTKRSQLTDLSQASLSCYAGLSEYPLNYRLQASSCPSPAPFLLYSRGPRGSSPRPFPHDRRYRKFFPFTYFFSPSLIKGVGPAFSFLFLEQTFLHTVKTLDRASPLYLERLLTNPPPTLLLPSLLACEKVAGFCTLSPDPLFVFRPPNPPPISFFCTEAERVPLDFTCLKEGVFHFYILHNSLPFCKILNEDIPSFPPSPSPKCRSVPLFPFQPFSLRISFPILEVFFHITAFFVRKSLLGPRFLFQFLIFRSPIHILS